MEGVDESNFVEPKRKSWSNTPTRCALRSMWKSFPCHSAWATPWVKLRAAHGFGKRHSGLSPTMSGHSSSLMNARACPTVGRKMSPPWVRSAYGFWRFHDAHLVAAFADVLATQVNLPPCSDRAAIPTSLAASASTPSRPPHITNTPAPNSAPRSIASKRFPQAYRRTSGSLGGERPLLEHRPGEQVGGDHRDGHPGFVQC